jgi:hypothetical protein
VTIDLVYGCFKDVGYLDQPYICATNVTGWPDGTHSCCTNTQVSNAGILGNRSDLRVLF